MSDEQAARPEGEIDAAKRETLQKLGQAAWAIPLVATFAVSGLNMSSAWALNGNGGGGGRHHS
jgi:hypothetical protein